MAETNQWMKKLNKMDNAVDRDYDPYLPENTIQTVSPSVNWLFPKSAGLPFMEFMLLWGPPKAGKSIISDMFSAAVHQKQKDLPTFYVGHYILDNRFCYFYFKELQLASVQFHYRKQLEVRNRFGGNLSFAFNGEPD